MTYHPGPGLYDRLQVLVGQFRGILIVDNGSSDEELAPVRRLVAAGLAEAVFNGQNKGQAVALNQGLAWGERRGVAWVATFDQDTVAASNLVEQAARVFDGHGGQPLAAIGAGWLITPRSRPDCDDPGGIEVVWVITSGALNSVRVWRAIGGFRDDFFIDYVDIEYCLRARSHGYIVVRVCPPTIQHAIGSPTQHRLLFRRVQPSNHNRVRRYFITRNRIRMWRMFWRTEPRYVLLDIKGAAKEVVKLLLFEDDRAQKLLAMFRGAGDGIRGVTGPLPSHSTRS